MVPQIPTSTKRGRAKHLIILSVCLAAGLTAAGLITLIRNQSSDLIVLASLICNGLGTLVFASMLMREHEKADQLSTLLLASLPAGKAPLGNALDMISQLVDRLHDSQTEFSLLVEKSEDVLCSITAEGIFVKVSPASEKIFGYKNRELEGTPISRVLAQGNNGSSNLDPVSESDTGFCSWPAMPEESSGTSFERTVRKKDGSIIDVLWSVHWSSTDDLFSCVAHDISDRKKLERVIRENEEQLRQVLDNLPIGVFVLNDTLSVEVCNAQSLSMLGAELPKIHGKPAAEVFDSTITRICQLSLEQDVVLGYKSTIRASDKEFVGEGNVVPFRSSAGNRLIVTILDVTAREQLDTMKREFVGNVSHELRTPLSALKVFLACLLDGMYGDLNERGQSKCRAADRNVTRLLALTNNLLDLDQAHSEDFKLFKQVHSVSGTINSAVDAVRQLLERARIEVDVLVPDDILWHIDEERIIQVLINLLSNAIKFSPRESKISIHVTAAEGTIVTQVIDQGCGIPTELVDSVFDRYKQIPNSTGAKGFGIGLSICRLLTEAHGGYICAASQHGQGSTFSFSIPQDIGQDTEIYQV